MPNVAYTRPEYTDLKPRWDLIRDCLAGETQVKRRGTAYLPMPNPTDTSPENVARYEQYVQRAVFFNATSYTANGMAGQVLSVEPAIELPKEVELMKSDVDGGGVSLKQQAGKTFSQVLAYGRCGLLADYPSVNIDNPATTVEQLSTGKVRPTVTLYEPWDIINWRTISVGGTTKLSMVVIAEQYVTDDDGFQQKMDNQWRVLYLDAEGLYVVEEWVKVAGKDEYIIKQVKVNKDLPSNAIGAQENGPADIYEPARYEPTDASGKRLDYIPFIFVGSVNNDPQPDLPPLHDLAVLNIAHYRNSADYEESSFITGQPTTFFTGLTEDWVTRVLKGVVQLGARASVLLPPNASAGMLQAAANSMPYEAMQHKEAQMVALGARLVQQQKVQRTATESSQESAAEMCVLATIANNTSEAYERVLGWARGFVNTAKKPTVETGKGDDEKEIEFRLNSDFRSASMNAQERAQLVAEWMSGAITDEEMRENMTRAGIATEEFDEWSDKKEEQALTKPIMAVNAAMGKPAPGALGEEKGQPTPAKKQGATKPAESAKA